MGSDDIFKKRRAQNQKRKKEFKDPLPNSFLIVSEGTKTEPLYFTGLAKYISEKYGHNSIEVKEPTIAIHGEGKCTVSLVEEASRIVKCANIFYEQVWVVFDKDDFSDFDEAIALAEKRGFSVAWSNQSFEYWIYLHFNYSDSSLHRDCWVEKLDELFKNHGIDKNGYKKNNPNIFDVVTKYGRLKMAMRHADRIKKTYSNNVKPSQCDPCTTVHYLIEALKPWLNELLEI